MLSTYSGGLGSPTMEGDPATRCHMGKAGRHHAQVQQPVTKGQMWHGSTYMRSPEEAPSKSKRQNGACQGLGPGLGQALGRCHVCGAELVWGDGGDGTAT